MKGRGVQMSGPLGKTDTMRRTPIPSRAAFLAAQGADQPIVVAGLDHDGIERAGRPGDRLQRGRRGLQRVAALARLGHEPTTRLRLDDRREPAQRWLGGEVLDRLLVEKEELRGEFRVVVHRTVAPDIV